MAENQNYSNQELAAMLGSVGRNVSVHRSVLMFSPQSIHLGSNVRIDCNSVLSAGSEGIHIGDYVHLATGVYLFGSGGKIVFESFSGLSSRVSIYTATDDYREGYLTNPTVPLEHRNVQTGDVVLRRHVIVGATTVILPGVTLGLASSVGALSLVRKSVPDFAVAVGNPLRIVGKRDESILAREREFLEQEQRRNQKP